MYKALLLSVVACLAATPSMAENLNCACQMALPGTAVVGQISRVEGQVLLFNDGEPAPAKAGGLLSVGGQVVTGPGSAASLAMGPCTMSVEANTEVAFIEADSKVCVRTAGVPATAGIPGGANGWMRQWPLFSFMAGEAGMVYWAEHGHREDKSISDE